MYAVIHLQKLQKVFSQYEEVTFKKGHIIEQPGDTYQYLYYITEGYVKLYSLSWNGQELILNIFPPNAYFYVLFPSSLENTEFYFSTLTSVRCKRAPRGDIVSYVKQNPDILFQLLEKVHQFGIEGLYKRMESLVFGNTRSKVATVLLTLAERFGQKDPITKEIVIEIPLTHKDIASLAGITRETTTHEMIKFKKEQAIIMKERNIVIPSLQVIKDLSLIT
jgi:CRP/FNR family transcriptional regulator